MPTHQYRGITPLQRSYLYLHSKIETEIEKHQVKDKKTYFFTSHASKAVEISKALDRLNRAIHVKENMIFYKKNQWLIISMSLAYAMLTLPRWMIYLITKPRSGGKHHRDKLKMGLTDPNMSQNFTRIFRCVKR